MSDFDFDLFVIGAGSGGVRAARIAAGHGAKVAIAEEYRFGGTCVIRGCVPKKLFVYASRFAGEFDDAAGFGWSVAARKFDWQTLIANKDKEIARLEAAYKNNLVRSGVEIFAARAELEDRHTVVLKGDGRRFRAKTILLATGSTANLDDSVEGIEHAVTSNEAFHLDELPQRVVVVGGGYIAVEFAGIFKGLGAQTTLVYRGEKILRGFDEDMRDALSEEYEKKGIKVLTRKLFARIEKTPAGLVGHFQDGGSIEADLIMYAIGRNPNTKGLGLQKCGVELGWNGHVVVDRESRSSVENIYAVGDITDRVQLTPVAIREGHAFADTMYGGRPWSVTHDLIPTAVFSDPEIGTVGLSEQVARERYPRIDIYKSEKTPAGLVGHFQDGGSIEADLIMYAIGRNPNTKGLGLQKCGVELGWNGHVVVDRESRSSVENIYAVGDITDRVQLTPVAIREGHAFADTMYGGRPWSVTHDLIPTAVFSDPEIGTVGLSEQVARERYPRIDIYKSRFRPMKYTIAGRDEFMLMKLLVDGDSAKVLGCHIIGPDAAEIVQMAAVAMKMGATKADFDATMALHPSAAEELVTMREKWQPR